MKLTPFITITLAITVPLSVCSYLDNHGYVLTTQAVNMPGNTPDQPGKNLLTLPGDYKGEWKALFDGKTLNGWHTYGENYAGSAWKVDDGVIHMTPVKDEQQQGDLVTNDEFENFDLKLEWKVETGSNSGIIFLVHEDTTLFKETYVTGLEMQVLDNIGASDNKKENHLAGTLYDLLGSAAVSKPNPVGEWNKAEIICDKGQLKLLLNDKITVSTTLWDDNWKNMVANSKFKKMPGFGTFKRGHIALQYHGHEVWYRNIEIKNLD
ncbi:MAG: DUF1080 domain-containing protein [Ginsengibacter sp.]